MTSPERRRSYLKQDDPDVKFDNDWEGDGKRKYRSSKSRSGNSEEAEGFDSNGRRRSTLDRNESRKRSGGSSKADINEDENDLRSKLTKKKQGENTLETLSNWYQDGELGGKYDNGDKTGDRGQILANEGVRRKSTSRFSDADGSETRNKGNNEKLHGGDSENALGRDSRRLERKDSTTEQGHVLLDSLKDSNGDKIGNYPESDVRKIDCDRSKKGRSHAIEEDRGGERNRREMDSSDRSRTPERSGRYRYDSESVEAEYEKRDTFRRKEQEKDGVRDDKSKGRDDGRNDGNKVWDGSKDGWKRRQGNFVDKEMKEGETPYEHGREWEIPRRGWIDNERLRSGGRKDGNRTEALKTSSKYGISNENYDVIEIQTRPFDYGMEEAVSSAARTTEVDQSSDAKSLPDDENYALPRDDRGRNMSWSGQSGQDLKEISGDGSYRDETESRAQKGDASVRAALGQTFSSGSEPPYGNQEPSSFNRAVPIGSKGGRVGRGGRRRPTGRDGHQFGPPMPMTGSPFGPLGMPSPGFLQSLAPNMSPAPGPPMSPGVFIPPFSPPVVWPGARGLEMNMLGVPPGPPPVLPGPGFPPNLGNPMYFNQSVPGRGAPPNMSGPNFNALTPAGRGQIKDKGNAGWVPPRTNAPPGKAPSRGEQNDYSQNFLDTGTRPQNFIRELELNSVVEDYPKLRELIQRKDEIVVRSSSPPMYLKCDLHEQELSPEFFGTKFDVILIDPPWEEYVHRAPGVTDHMEYWTFEEIMNLKIEAIADTPSFVFLWVGDGVGLEQGRQCLKKWGFRRCEDICWVKTNKTNATPGLRHDSHTLFQRSKEHCLLGIKGTVRRSTDGHIIHANIDTDVIIAEEPPYGSTAKPEHMYRIIEHFALGRRRLELFGEDHNIRSGWLTVGKGLSSSNFSAETYVRNFADRDGKVWQGGGGRNPPPGAPHLVITTPEIESLRPKSPMKNQQQQTASISVTTTNSSNKRAAENNNNSLNVNQETSSSNIPNTGPWVPPMESFQGREGGGHMISDNRHFDIYRYNAAFRQTNTEFLEFESHMAMNL
ncbi:hypothetical protein RND71_025758 [Anisodus tanguticus]|uniref:Methyltransferase-like protein 1 n=1 Tax=Anisodus tanguticus TaxID=243964 RepID=A0AAE1RJJ1_9SOLA|nr:hypothetical protein RND71_025758 [Anisodus tanguticus]